MSPTGKNRGVFRFFLRAKRSYQKCANINRCWIRFCFSKIERFGIRKHPWHPKYFIFRNRCARLVSVRIEWFFDFISAKTRCFGKPQISIFQKFDGRPTILNHHAQKPNRVRVTFDIWGIFGTESSVQNQIFNYNSSLLNSLRNLNTVWLGIMNPKPKRLRPIVNRTGWALKNRLFATVRNREIHQIADFVIKLTMTCAKLLLHVISSGTRFPIKTQISNLQKCGRLSALLMILLRKRCSRRVKCDFVQNMYIFIFIANFLSPVVDSEWNSERNSFFANNIIRIGYSQILKIMIFMKETSQLFSEINLTR